MDRDAREKSDAAREAFLAELARDAKKNISKGGDHSKQSQEKLKDKKKTKDNRKNRDSKVLCQILSLEPCYLVTFMEKVLF